MKWYERFLLWSLLVYIALWMYSVDGLLANMEAEHEKVWAIIQKYMVRA